MSAEFDAAVEPLRADLLRVLDAGQATREGHGFMPDAASPAMAELATEDQYRGDWGQKPVQSAHSWAGVLLAGSEDQLRTMCRVVVGDPSLYGPQSLARSGLEMAGRAYWLTEPGIGARRRVARHQTERLFNAYQLRRLTGDTEWATKTGKTITAAASALGMDLLRGKKYAHTHVIEERPSGTAVFMKLMQDVDDHGLGHTMFAYLSAVDHGTLYGLLQAVDPVEATTPFGQDLGALRMSASHTNQLLGVATLGYVTAASRRNELFGWVGGDWDELARNVVGKVFDVIRLQAA